MERALVVGLGGVRGTGLRYGVGAWVGRWKSGWAFPLETLAINVTGCFVFGVLAGLVESRGAFAGTTRTFLLVGVLGGYTTFSTFGYETFQLLRDGHWPAAGLSTGLQLGLGIGGVWLGHALAKLIR